MTVAGRLSCLFGASAQPGTFRRSELPANHLDSLSANTTNHQNYNILPSSSSLQNSHSLHIGNTIINSSVYFNPYPVRIPETQPSGGFLPLSPTVTTASCVNLAFLVGSRKTGVLRHTPPRPARFLPSAFSTSTTRRQTANYPNHPAP